MWELKAVPVQDVNDHFETVGWPFDSLVGSEEFFFSAVALIDVQRWCEFCSRGLDYRCTACVRVNGEGPGFDVILYVCGTGGIGDVPTETTAK